MSLPIIPVGLIGTLTEKTPTAFPYGELPIGLSLTAAVPASEPLSFDQSLQAYMKQTRFTQLAETDWVEQSLEQTEIPFPIPVIPIEWQGGRRLPLNLDETGKTLPPAVQSMNRPLPPIVDPQTGAPLSPLRVAMTEGLVQKSSPIAAGTLPVTPDPPLPAMETLEAEDPVRACSTPHTPTPQPIPTIRGTLPLLAVEVPVDHADWDKAMGERIQWMISRNLQQAEVKLNPPNLGPLEVRVSLQHDQANVTFLAAQAPVREALEAAIPRLREMFGEASLNLSGVDVGQRESSGREHPRDGAAAPGMPPSSGGAGEGPDHSPVSAYGVSPVRGVVDDYA